MENNNEWIEYSPDDIDCLHFLTDVLPDWTTTVTSITNNSSREHVEVRFLIAAKEENEIKRWLEEFQERSKTTYSIKSTDQSTGRYVQFKQRLYCHHNTGNAKVYDPSIKNRTKNTNCPSIMTITLHAVKKRYKGINKDNAPNPEMPCEIRLVTTHNHAINTADALRFRKVSKSTQSKLLQLYSNGHTPATALETIKMDIHEQHENLEIALADRKICPSYNYCYHIYRQDFKKKYGPLEFDKLGKKHLQKLLSEFNDSTDAENNDHIEINNENLIEISSQKNEQNVKEGKELIKKISATMNNYLEGATDEVLPALKLFNDRLNKIKTKAAFVSSLSRFATEYQRKNRLKPNPMQTTAISRRRPKLSGKHSRAGGQPRKSVNPILGNFFISNEKNIVDYNYA